MSAERESLFADPEPVMFINGHWLGHCDREHGHWSCDCAENYADIFNRCPECGADLDDRGECTEYEEHFQ